MNKKRAINKTLTLMLVASALICVLILSGCSFSFDIGDLGNLSNLRPSTKDNDEFDRYTEEYFNLLSMIDELFIGEFDAGKLHTEAMRALVDALDDEWSFYMTEDEYHRFAQRATNRYSGIGVDILVNDKAGGMEVTRVHRGSPSETGGILIGDIIIYVDGQSIAGFSIQDVREILARPLGEYVQITVIRGEENVMLTIMYAEIFIDPVEFELLENNIGYIILSNFDADSSERFISAVETLIEKGATSFIYDVRSNPGGRLGEMTTILDFLLPEGEIFIQENNLGEESIIMSDKDWLDMPAVVLINRFSYSAAEYFAAMLSEYEYAKVVGEQTTGKNRTQTTHRIPDGGALHISTTQYLTKNRISLIDIGGFAPDYPIELTDEDIILLLSGKLDKDKDLQLQKAISLLQARN